MRRCAKHMIQPGRLEVIVTIKGYGMHSLLRKGPKTRHIESTDICANTSKWAINLKAGINLALLPQKQRPETTLNCTILKKKFRYVFWIKMTVFRLTDSTKINGKYAKKRH